MKVKVCDAITNWLAEKGITHAFGIVGGGNVALWDAITRGRKTQIICVHHEQAAAMAAAYYYRTCGRIAIALVTTGAGSTNAITGAMAAFMDSAPVLVISGNEAERYMGARTRVWGVQGYDSSGLATRFTKWAYRACSGTVIAALDEGMKFALKAPQGPVWVDIPKDVQSALA